MRISIYPYARMHTCMRALLEGIPACVGVDAGACGRAVGAGVHFVCHYVHTCMCVGMYACVCVCMYECMHRLPFECACVSACGRTLAVQAYDRQMCIPGCINVCVCKCVLNTPCVALGVHT